MLANAAFSSELTTPITWAHVIGVVSSEEKAAFASKHGCHNVIISKSGDIAAQAKTLTGGEGVTAVFDAVGADTFEASLAALRP